ncbi:hypothetical protein BC833DRAFT_586339 [Globomyces pollinis-pini]|nr:hypothetical protein BC833DRAFT_586339 [Globomyces pollinis-pini]
MSNDNTVLSAISMFDSMRNRLAESDNLDTNVLDGILTQLFQEAQASAKGTPPASKQFVANLPTLKNLKDVTCPICTDECTVEALELPCSHKFHGECVLTWLKLHNTCPCCRIEFPTDDPEYERMKREAKQAQIVKEDSEEDWDPFYG